MDAASGDENENSEGSDDDGDESDAVNALGPLEAPPATDLRAATRDAVDAAFKSALEIMVFCVLAFPVDYSGRGGVCSRVW